MKLATALLLLCLGSAALSQHIFLKGEASDLRSVRHGKQCLHHLFSSINDPMTARADLHNQSYGYSPWEKQPTGLPEGQFVFTLYAVDSMTVWGVANIATGPSRLFTRTTDGGKTWISDTVRIAPPSYCCKSVYAFDADRAWILMHDHQSSSGGIFHTIDGGRTWQRDTTVFNTINGCADFIHFFDADNGVAVGDPTNGSFEIYTTSNGGAQWARVPGASIPAPMSEEYGVTGEFTAAGNSLWFPSFNTKTSRIFKTTDKGVTWSASVYPEIPEGWYPTVEFQDEHVGVSSGDFGDVRTTTDGGATWTKIAGTQKYGLMHIEYVPKTPGMYMATSVLTSDFLAERYLCGTMVSLDRGAHWAWTNRWPADNYPDLRLASAAAGWLGDHLSSNVYAWRIPSGRIAGVHPDSLKFAMLEVGLKSDTIAVDFINHGTDPLTLSRIEMPEKEFTVIRQPSLPVTLSSLEAARVELSFGPGANGMYGDSMVFVSNASNAPRAGVLLQAQGLVMQPAVKGKCYAAAKSLYNVDIASGAPAVIGDLGQTVVHGLAVHPSTGILYASFSGASTSTIYRICCGTGIQREVHKYPFGGLRAIAFNSEGSLYGASTSGRLYRLDLSTGDTIGIGTAAGVVYGSIAFSPSGKLWASVLSPRTGKDNIYTVNTASGEATLIGSTGDGTVTPSIFFDAGGKLYGMKGTSGQVNTVISIDTLTGAGTTLVSTNMTGLTAMTIASAGTVAGVATQSTLPDRFGLEQNYPNPFNPSTTIRYQLPKAGSVKLVIIDLLGREVATLVNEVKQPGAYDVRWDASAAASGVYFYRLQSGTFIGVKRLMIIK